MVHPDAADVGKVYLPLEILQPATHGLSLPSIDTQQPARLHEEWTLSTPLKHLVHRSASCIFVLLHLCLENVQGRTCSGKKRSEQNVLLKGELVRRWRTRANVFLLLLLVGRTLGRTLGNIIDDYRSMEKDLVL